jgi:molybdopterin synthase catalytic subunit
MAVMDAQDNMEDGPATLTELIPPKSGDWVGVSTGPLPVEAAWQWAVLPGCGGIVTFCGTVRDHSEGRPGVTWLE